MGYCSSAAGGRKATIVALRRRRWPLALPALLAICRAMNKLNTYRSGPDERGRFGVYGGRFVAETLMPLVLEVEQAYRAARDDAAFQEELRLYLKEYVGRPSPLWLAQRLTDQLGGRQDLFQARGAEPHRRAQNQFLHGPDPGGPTHGPNPPSSPKPAPASTAMATATVCALFGLPCTIYMGATDVERQQPNVFRMKLLGAEVVPVTSGAATLKDAMNEALRDWVANVSDTYYLIGTVAGPHPFPMMVRDFQSVIGEEARAQLQEKEGRLPDCGSGVRGRRIERDGAVLSVSGRSRRAADRGGGRGAGVGQRQDRRLDRARQTRRAARQPHLSAAIGRRPDRGSA